jgi:adenosine deaminase
MRPSRIDTAKPLLPAGLPLVDLHLHQERSARLNQVLAARGHEISVDWRAWSGRLMALPPGIRRLEALWDSCPTPYERDTPDLTVARFRALLAEAAAAGAVLAEVRVGNETVRRPELGDLFREAERQVRVRHPHFRAALVGTLKLWQDASDVEAAFAACIRHGLGGVDFLYLPYDADADWTTAYGLADRAAAAGLGVTAHAGEFSPNNIAAALRLAGLSRLGHAVHAVAEPRLLDLLLASGAAVECCLTSNILLGAAPSLAEHPIRRLWEAGVPVVLGTDNPLQFATTIADEYSLAASLGLVAEDLVSISRTAVKRSFAPPALKAELLARPPLSVARR